MTAEVFASLPVTLTIRELRYTIKQPKFRVKSVTLVTTLLDPKVYPAEALADLCRSRWHVETNFAHLKTTLGRDVLSCQTEAGVRRELSMFAIVYNLVRAVMEAAGRRQVVSVHRISFIAVLRWLATVPPGGPLLVFVVNPARSDRVEPRCKKRRAKNDPYMIRPRDVLRKHLLAECLAA